MVIVQNYRLGEVFQTWQKIYLLLMFLKNVLYPKIFLLFDSIVELKKVLKMETFECKQFLLPSNTMIK